MIKEKSSIECDEKLTQLQFYGTADVFRQITNVNFVQLQLK